MPEEKNMRRTLSLFWFECYIEKTAKFAPLGVKLEKKGVVPKKKSVADFEDDVFFR